MKKLSVLSLLMCVGSLTLAGCNNGSGGGGKKTTTGGATTSDSGTTSGGTSSTSGTSGTSGTSTSSGPVYPTDWSDSLKSSMQELLDGVVLPYVPATWTAQSYGLPFGAAGEGASLSDVKAAFDQAGYVSSSLISGAGLSYVLEKESTNGIVYAGLGQISQTSVGIAAGYSAYASSWSSEQTALFTEKLGSDVQVPFVRGLWNVAVPQNGYLRAVRSTNSGRNDVLAAYENATGWTFDHNDSYGDPVYVYVASSGATIESNIWVQSGLCICDFSYNAPEADAWRTEDLAFMHEHLAGGEIPHPAGLWSYPIILNNTVYTKQATQTTTLPEIKAVFEDAGFLVAADPEDENGYIFTKVAPELDSDSNEQYIVGWIFENSENALVIQAYVDSDPTVTDEFELYTSALSVHTGDSVTLTVNMGNLFTSEDVPQFSVDPADGAELVSSEGNQYVYQINAAAGADVTFTVSIRDGAFTDSVVVHVEDESVPTDWAEEIKSEMQGALEGVALPFTHAEWEIYSNAEATFALRAPFDSNLVTSVCSAIAANPDYEYLGAEEGVECFATELESGNVINISVYYDEEYVYYDANLVEPSPVDLAAAAVNSKLSALGVSVSYDSTYNTWGGAWGVGSAADETEETLSSGAEFLAEAAIPDGFTLAFSVYGDPTSEGYYDLFGDESYYYYMLFSDASGDVNITIISYVDSQTLVASITIGSAS